MPRAASTWSRSPAPSSFPSSANTDSMLSSLMTSLVHSIEQLGYLGLILLMAMESSILPVPSELVMPPAGYLAAQGKMNIGLALLCGIVGSMIGAYVNYVVASKVGRWVFVRYGKWVLL